MKNLAAGLVGIVAAALAGAAMAQEDMTERIQELEQPGSEIEMDIGGGGAEIHRKSGAPVLAPGEIELNDAAPPLDDPDTPPDGDDPIDAELPGEGPEDLSGPVGEDD
jgi:hypothetical protein